MNRLFAPYRDKRLCEYEDVFSSVVASLNIAERSTIRLVFVESLKLAPFCFARHVEGLDLRVVVMTSGAIPYLYNFFQYITSRYDCLPSLGIATRERNLPYQGRLHNTVNFVEILQNRGLVKHVSAIDPDRSKFGLLMADFAVKFLLLHELGHCVAGHLEPLTMGFDESGGDLEENYGAILRRHTLEMDADAYAITCILENIVRARDPNSLQVWPGFENLPTHNAHLLPAFIAILMLFRFWPSPPGGGSKLADLLVGSHPFPAVRSQLVMVNFFSHHVGANLLGDEVVLKNTYSTGIIAATRCCVRLTGVRENRWLFGSTEGGRLASRRYLNLLLRQWHKLRPELEPRALINLAPLDMEALTLEFDG